MVRLLTIEWPGVRYFKPHEFKCRCGVCESDGLEMSQEFIRKLDDLRHRLNHPLRVSSGYRCPDYNASLSTTGRDGPHTTGRAVDIAVSGQRAFNVVTQASLGGWFSGIGVHQRGDFSGRFIHLDDLMGDTRPRIWTY